MNANTSWCFYCGEPLSMELPVHGPALCGPCTMQHYGDLFTSTEDFEGAEDDSDSG